MTEAKPILLIQINYPSPTTNDIWSGSRYTISDDPRVEVSFQKSMEIRFPDYHVMCFNGYDEFIRPRQVPIELQVFNSDSITDIEFDEIKEIITNALTRTGQDNS